MAAVLTFHGAAGCVTGSCMLLEIAGRRLLIDCGMFQGSKTLKKLNYEPFPFAAASIDAVLLTHAHIDHSGLLPKLVRAGFHGPIHATSATRDLCQVMLADSAGIQESEVRHLNRRNARRGLRPVEPIYTAGDVARTIRLFHRVRFGETVTLGDGLRATWWPAGHLLGAASIQIQGDEGPETLDLLFSGDVDSGRQPFLPAPAGPAQVDHVVLESTYGDRERIDLDLASRRTALATELRQAKAAGGPLLLPTFAVTIDCYSGHGDASDLVAWLNARGLVSGSVLLDHGEPCALGALAARLRQTGYDVVTPELDQSFRLTRGSIEPLTLGEARLRPGQATRPDWHNNRAAFLVALNERLQSLEGDQERTSLLAQLTKSLEE